MNPFDLRPIEGDLAAAPSHLINTWGSTCSRDQGLPVKEQEIVPESIAIPPSTDISGSEFSLRSIEGSMNLDAGIWCMGKRYSPSLQLPNSYASTAANLSTDSSHGSLGSHTSQKFDAKATRVCRAVSPKANPPSPVKKRGRPRKTHIGAPASIAAKMDTTDKAARRTSTRSDTVLAVSEGARASRVREKNRIAADKCRARRRLEEDRLKFKHGELEREHGRLSGALSDLTAETYVLKNMLIEHGSCDCQLIQNYLEEAASKWVGQKLHR